MEHKELNYGLLGLGRVAASEMELTGLKEKGLRHEGLL